MENLNLVNTKYAIEMLRKHGVSNGGTLGFHAGWCDIAADQLESALALINSQEQRIGAQDMTISELRQRAEKAEHDADRYAQKIKELTEENERLRAGNIKQIIREGKQQNEIHDANMKDKLIQSIREVSIVEKTYEEYVEALADKLLVVIPNDSEVAREIFEEIDDLFKRYRVNTYGGCYYYMGIKEEFNELKKKYTENKK